LVFSPRLSLDNLLNRTHTTLVIRSKKSTKKRPRPSNEISEDEISYFLDKLKEFGGLPKVRDLRKLLRDGLDPTKVDTILKYLERSGRLQIDLDGNIIWIRRDKEEVNQISFAEAANISADFLKYFSKKSEDPAE
jgi:predicted Rdx family selenoprotein